MDCIELIFIISIGLLIGFLFGNLTNNSFFEGYQKGFDDYKAQVLPLIEKSESIVNECADKAMIVIDERDACNLDLVVCKNTLNYCKGVN